MNSIIKNKKILIICLSVLVIIICIIIYKMIFTNTKNINQKREYKVVEENKLTDSKESNTYRISNIIISKEDIHVFITFDITNITKENQKEKNVYFVLLGSEEKEITKLKITIPELKIQETTQMKTDVTNYYGDSRNFRLEE